MHAFETAEGGAVAAEIVAILESELVRFCHRVAHDHGVAVDRARSSMVMLGTLVAAGARWTARPDSAPTRIHDAFAELAARQPADWPLAADIRREVAAFLDATASVAVSDVADRSPAGLLRSAGSDPDLWWWAAAHDTPERCWTACGEHAPRLVQVALALGVPADRVGRAIAAVLGGATQKTKTRRVAQRDDLLALLSRLASRGGAAIADSRELVARTTKLAFESAATQLAARRDVPPTDGIADLAVLAFQLVALFELAGRPPDLERYGELAARADATFTRRGMRFAALVRSELDAELRK